ncbi:MAG: efflux RND transporter permease subunit [Candidatus Cloacimonetes bacterium]|nr:efflux RND transporter permease subunit [Candidatus Cloacimonadota bacterium]
MFISDFSVRHKVTVLMVTLMIILFGVLSFIRLGLDVLPEMEFPMVSVVTPYFGASPEEVESLVTANIEMAVSGIRGLKNIHSTSSENFSSITLEFEWGLNLDVAAQDIRDAVDRLTDMFPADVSRPMIMKFSTSSMPVVMYGVTGMENSHELRKLLEDDISNRLKRIDGVGMIAVWGGDELEVQIQTDRFKMDQYRVSFDDISLAVMLQNMNISAGNININQESFFIRTIAEFKTLEEIENIPVKVNIDGSMVRIRDVAEVVEAPRETRYHIRTNQKPTVAIMITKESEANTLSVTRAITQELNDLVKSGQFDIEFHEIMNFGDMIELATNSAGSSVLWGSIFAILMMFFFIRNWRPTLAISLAIPVSVIATFIPMYLMDFSLNLMTISGLALGVGMLVDNAVVVIENIFRHLEEGADRITASINGTKEVAMAISASTFTTIAVFLPMVFSGGMTAILVRGLALTVAFSLLVSLFVALTIVPTIASVIYSDKTDLYKKLNWFEWIRDRYISLLKWCLKNRKKTIFAIFITLIFSALLLTQTGAEFMPASDNPFVMLSIKMPVGTTLEETDALVAQIENVFDRTPEIESFLIMTGASDDSQARAGDGNPTNQTEAVIWGRLVNFRNRDKSQPEVLEFLRTQIPHIQGGEIAFVDAMAAGGSTNPIEIKIFGNDLEELSLLAGQISQLMQEVPNIRDIQNSMVERSPEIHFRINRDMAMQYGLTATQIASTIRTAISGSNIGILRTRGEEINIRLQYREDQRMTIEDFSEIRIYSPIGVSIPLNQLVTQEFGEGHAVIVREGQVRKATLTANIVGSDLAGVTRDLRTKLNPFIMSMPIGYVVEFGGAYQDMIEGFITLSLALLLSLILVYMVMASQFESLKQPFIIMFTLPLCIIGVALAVFLTGSTISVLTFVGLIILSGIIVNNAIVLIDYANQLRQKGMSIHEALVKAGYDRMRPVLITSLTTVIGMLPMALTNAEGAEMQNPIAITIIGGLLSATFFTLVVIPVIYSLFDKEKEKIIDKIS